MKPILEYLKRRNTQVYGINDHSFKGMILALQDLNYKELSSLLTMGTSGIFKGFKEENCKCYLSYTSTNAILAYNPENTGNECLIIHFKGNNIRYYEIGAMNDDGRVTWHLDNDRYNIDIIDKFFEI